jgi:hypothetical protein
MNDACTFYVYRAANMPADWGYIISKRPLPTTETRMAYAPQIWTGEAIDADDALAKAKLVEPVARSVVYNDDDVDEEGDE